MWKYSKIWSSNWLPSTHVSLLLCSLQILFFLLLWKAFWWKYLVFPPPSVSHMTRDCCRHIISSFLSQTWTSFLISRWAYEFLKRRSDSCKFFRACWAFLRFCCIFSKVVLFQWLSFTQHNLSILGICRVRAQGGLIAHTNSIILKNSSSPTHMDSNMKGFSLCHIFVST